MGTTLNGDGFGTIKAIDGLATALSNLNCSTTTYRGDVTIRGDLHVSGNLKVDGKITTGLDNMKPHFGGGFVENGKIIYIEKAIFNEPYVILIFSDGTKATCKCSEKDVYDKEKGALICMMKRIHGSDAVIDLFNDWCYGNEDIRTMKEVRKDRKKHNKK